MSEQQVFVNPGAYSQGVNTAIAQQNTNLGTLKGFYNMGTEINKRNDFSNLYNQASQNNTTPAWEDIEAVYAKYGDTQGVERAKEQAYKRDVNQFGIKAKHYFDQAEKAYNTGNDDALFAVQKMVNDDPVITKFMDKVTFMPNNQIEYTVKKDQDILMDGDVVKKASAGDKVVAYKGVDENGQPRFYATKIEPTSMSTAIQRGKSTGGSGSSPKSITTFNKEVDKMVTGKGVFSDELYTDAIDLTDNPTVAHKQYMAAQNFMDTEATQNYLKPEAIEVKRKFVEKSYGQRLAKDWSAIMQTKEFQEVAKERNPQKATLYIMNVLGIPEGDYEEVVSLLQQYPPKLAKKKVSSSSKQQQNPLAQSDFWKNYNPTTFKKPKTEADFKKLTFDELSQIDDDYREYYESIGENYKKDPMRTILYSEIKKKM